MRNQVLYAYTAVEIQTNYINYLFCIIHMHPCEFDFLPQNFKPIFRAIAKSNA